ncbi:MAG: hypothetical protein ACR2QZ_16795 [Woeseiaceae bacterium]
MTPRLRADINNAKLNIGGKSGAIINGEWMPREMSRRQREFGNYTSDKCDAQAAQNYVSTVSFASYEPAKQATYSRR